MQASSRQVNLVLINLSLAYLWQTMWYNVNTNDQEESTSYDMYVTNGTNAVKSSSPDSAVSSPSLQSLLVLTEV
jgi:hypothetical protein